MHASGVLGRPGRLSLLRLLLTVTGLEETTVEPLARGHGHSLEAILISSVREALGETRHLVGEAPVIGVRERALRACAGEPDRIGLTPKVDHARAHLRGGVLALDGEGRCAEREVE